MTVPQPLFLPLLQFFLFTALVKLHGVSGIDMVTRRALISLWMPHGGQRAMPLMGPCGRVKIERGIDMPLVGR
jgi:hypothetical protein